MQVKLKDVAAKAGVSFQTVSRILNGRGEGHNRETRERVLAVARDLGYRKHSSASMMRQGRFNSVALLLSESRSHSLLSDRLRDGILDALRERDNHLIVARMPDAHLTSEEQMPRILRELAADGLLINYNAAIPAEMIALINRYQMPAIWLNSVHDADCVFPDDVEAGRMGTTYLLERGHRRIAYLHWSSGHYSHQHREEGYRAAMRQVGLPAHSLMTHDVHKDPIQHDFSWLIGPERCTAFLCYSPEVTSQLLLLALQFHLRIPDDISVITFDDAPNHVLGYRVDSVLLPYEQMGQEAISLLFHKMEEPTARLTPRKLTPSLEPGATVRPR